MSYDDDTLAEWEKQGHISIHVWVQMVDPSNL